MIKIVSLIRRHPGMDAEAFRAYWRDVHAPLVRARVPGLIHYTGSFPAAGGLGQVEVGALHYDAVIELGFPDRATMDAAMAGAAFQDQDRRDSSARFMDADGSRAMVVEVIDALRG